MKTKLKFAVILPLIAFGFLVHSAPLNARDASAKEVVNSNQSFWSPFALLEEANKFPSFASIGAASGLSMYEEADHLVVQANLPGLEAEEIEVTFDRGSLHIKGERREEKKKDDRNYYHKSRNAFAYNVEIPSNIDESKSPTAEYKNGLMTITFEKSESAKPKKIKIQKR